MKNQGRNKKTVLTRSGEITFYRTILMPADEESKHKLSEMQDAKGVCPLDSALRLDKIPFKITPGMMCDIAKEAVRAPSYERATEIILEHYNVKKISVKTVRDVTNYIGALVYSDDCKRADIAMSEKDRKFDKRKKSRKPEDILYIEMDGAMVNTREKNGNGKQSSWKECKIGMAFLNEDLETRISRSGEERRRIKKKRFVGHIGNYKKFEDLMLGLAARFEYKKRAGIVVISDGADWIHTIVTELFPNAVHIIDLAHVKEHICDFAKNNITSEEERKSWIGSMYTLLDEGNIEKILSKLEQYKGAENDGGKLYTYIDNHKTSMNYKEYRDKGYFVGSGASESANKYVMQNRMKLEGMRWNIETGQGMLALKTRYEGRCWDEVQSIVEKSFGL